MRLPLVLVLLFCLFPWLHAQEAKEESPPPWPILKPAAEPSSLPNTAPLDWEGDLASRMITGIDGFLLSQIEASIPARTNYWKRDLTNHEAYIKSIEKNRERFQDIIGLTKDKRFEEPRFEIIQRQERIDVRGQDFVMYTVRWRAFRDVWGEGLLFVPTKEPVADVIVLPDASQAPEELAGLPANARVPVTSNYVLTLVRANCRVLVPTIIDRAENQYKMSNREWLHRPAFELGRTLVGYEVQKVLSAIDAFQASQRETKRPVGVVGWGEGGRIALYAAASDTRIACAGVSGYFGSRKQVWDEPADRNVFRLLREFGDAEVASLIAPRGVVVEHSKYPEYVFRPDENGAPQVSVTSANKNGKPGRLLTPDVETVQAEIARFNQLLEGLTPSTGIDFIKASDPVSDDTLRALLRHLGVNGNLDAAFAPKELSEVYQEVMDRRNGVDLIQRRLIQQMEEIERHNQWALLDSERVRKEYFAKLKPENMGTFTETIKPYRQAFQDEVIGSLGQPFLPPKPRSRKYQEGEKTVSYEVVLDVFPEVFAYGILTVPKNLDLSGKEKRPVVVCQHGLEGRPQDVISEAKFNAYKAFATRLAERGFITFAPQNPYIFHDRFRTLQFKANAIGCTLFSVIVPQHQQITGWLATQPFVDPERIAFYGLSYGGKSAMRIPPLVDGYCLSICSADFNDWIWKNAATDPLSLRYSYTNKREYEIFEFNLGNTFNYSEMAALIAPRPFMVERGHFDGVAPDSRVAYEFAKVRHLYGARLGLDEKVNIEWFVGPHSINGEGSYDFLHEHLNWPKPKS